MCTEKAEPPQEARTTARKAVVSLQKEVSPGRREREIFVWGVSRGWTTTTTTATANSIWPDGKRAPYAARGCNSPLSPCNLLVFRWLRASRRILMDSLPINPTPSKSLHRLPSKMLLKGILFLQWKKRSRGEVFQIFWLVSREFICPLNVA